MSDYSNAEALAILGTEGTGYAVQDYADGSNFADPITANLWTAAGASLDALVAYLESDTGDSLENY